MTKNKVILAFAVGLFLFVGIYFFMTVGAERDIKVQVDLYIKAVSNNDFKSVYNLNAVTQKRVLFILKGSDNKALLLNQAFNEQKEIFDSQKNSFVPNAMWSEKAVFTKGMRYRINKVAMETDVDNPTAFYRKRINAAVEIEAEYDSPNAAPFFNAGSVKKGTLVVKMVHSKNIGKTLKSMAGAQDNKWFFKGVAMRQNSIVYWQEK